jgi:acyl-[acyl-carrier-protein] desaturase
MDYTNILDSLIKEWNIGNICNLTGAAEKGRDYLMALPDRFRRVSERTPVKPPSDYKFNWIY